MKIIKCLLTEDTERRLWDTLPANFERKKILINLGVSTFEDEHKYPDYKIINRVKAIKRCVDKGKSLEILKRHRIKTVKSFDLEKLNPLLFIYLALRYLIWDQKLILKRNGHLKIVDFQKFFSELENINRYSYITVKEDKEREYRVLLYKGKPFRVMEKNGNPSIFAWKNEHCHFSNVKAPKEVIDEGFPFFSITRNGFTL